MSAALRIRRTGPLCLVEDLGRPGLSAIGVGRSGAADRSALCQANRALANPEDAAALEVTFGGLELEVVQGPVWLCVTGAPAPVSVDGREVGPYSVFSAAGRCRRPARHPHESGSAPTSGCGAGSTSDRCSARAATT